MKNIIGKSKTKFTRDKNKPVELSAFARPAAWTAASKVLNWGSLDTTAAMLSFCLTVGMTLWTM